LKAPYRINVEENKLEGTIIEELQFTVIDVDMNADLNLMIEPVENLWKDADNRVADDCPEKPDIQK